MNGVDAARLLNNGNVSAISRSRRLSGIESLSIDGVQAAVSGLLGSGGSKEVYDATVGGQHYALALPGTVDFPQIVIEKWNKVLREPVNTDRLRDLGLYVNDVCQVVSTIVNGHEFPALIMKKYSDHNFPVYDSKNLQGRDHELIKSDGRVDDEAALRLFAPIGIEVASLIRGGARLGRDCFNLCDISGVPHLYHNDLGAATFRKISEGDLERYADGYVSSAFWAFVNTITEKVYRGNPYVNSMVDPECSLQPKLVESVMGILKESTSSS